MGLAMSKFLNTTTHFSVNDWTALEISSMGSGLTRFSPLNGEVNAVATESDVSQQVRGNIVIVGMSAKANANSLDVPMVVTFRDDGADTLAAITIPAGNTSVNNSGSLNIAVADASLCNLQWISGAGTGAIDNIAVTVQYQRVLN